MAHVHIIAEAGNNHGGDLAVGKQLSDVAKDVGADSVKFQIINPEGLYVPGTWEGEKFLESEVLDIRRKQMLPVDDIRRLSEYCNDIGIPYSASIFDSDGLALLDSLDPPYLKIASTDLNNGPLLKAAAETGRKLIVSTGMSTLGEVEVAVEQIVSAGNRDLVLLHCVSVYPCPVEMMNLRFIERLKASFDFPIGFSDHSESSVPAAIAVGMGVTWIEKHYTLDRGAEGFDHAYAMEPDMLKGYIEDVRAAEAACTVQEQKVGEGEGTVRQRARRSLYAARDLAPGEVLGFDDVLIVRPEGELAPNDIDAIVGRSIAHPVRMFEPLTWKQFS